MLALVLRSKEHWYEVVFRTFKYKIWDELAEASTEHGQLNKTYLFWFILTIISPV